jgi:hypothetical protein
MANKYFTIINYYGGSGKYRCKAPPVKTMPSYMHITHLQQMHTSWATCCYAVSLHDSILQRRAGSCHQSHQRLRARRWGP